MTEGPSWPDPVVRLVARPGGVRSRRLLARPGQPRHTPRFVFANEYEDVRATVAQRVAHVEVVRRPHHGQVAADPHFRVEHALGEDLFAALDPRHEIVQRRCRDGPLAVARHLDRAHHDTGMKQ